MNKVFNNLIHSLMRSPTARATKNQRKARLQRSLAVETLEDRRLLALLQYTPDNGTETELIINVNEQGAFGYSDDLAVNNDQIPQEGNEVGNAEYNPVGTIELTGTTFASGIAIGFGEYNRDRLRPELVDGSVEQRHFLTTGYIGGRGVDNGNGDNLSGRFIEDESDPPNVLVSEFLYPNTAQNENEAILSFRLVQTLTPLILNGAPNGAVLEQTYTIQNISDEELHFDIIRYMDADLHAFEPDEPGQPDTQPPENGGGLRRDGNVQAITSVYTQLAALNSPINDPTIVTIRNNPDDSLGIPPGQVNRWEIGRGSAVMIPDHNVWVSDGYTVLRRPPDGGPALTPGPWWKVLRADWWHDVWAVRDPDSYDPSPGGDFPDPLPIDGTLLFDIVTGEWLDDDITNEQTFPVSPPPAVPDGDNNDHIDINMEYDIAMALRNVYTQVAPSQQFEYFTQTVFGNPPLGQLSNGRVAGVVFDDVNGNGVEDGGEPGLFNWRVFVDYDNDGVLDGNEPNAFTDSLGGYVINNVPAGTQTIALQVEPLYNQTAPAPVPPGTYSITVPPGSTVPNIDFGAQFQGGYVNGTKFMDLNGDTNQDLPAEVGVANWQIYVDINLNGVYDPFVDELATTDANGDYTFTLTTGTYEIREVPQANWTQTAPVGGVHTINITAAGQVFNGIDFGNDPDPFTISGIKWEDEFPDGIQSGPEEPGMADVRIYIDVNNDGIYTAGTDISDVTAADGTYSISSGDLIGPGTWVVREEDRRTGDAVPTFDQTFPGGDGSHTLTLGAGAARTGVNFGNRFKRATVTGFVWHDANNNQMHDPPVEQGIPGIFIYADLNGDGFRSVGEPGGVTGSDGTYRIENLRPGTYEIRQGSGTATSQTFPTPPGGHPVTLEPGETRTGLDFGNLYVDARDFGDAPFPYPTTLAANGAVHTIIPGYRLGLEIDPDPNGQPTVGADGDDLDTVPDDEDGVVFLTPIVSGQTAQVQVTLTQDGIMGQKPPQGKLQAWIDFNGNGTWTDPGEQIFTNQRLLRGPNVLTFTVPNVALPANTYARFRLGLESDLQPTGPSRGGETEDYRVFVTNEDLPDVIGRASTGAWQVGRNTGTGFVNTPAGSWVEADGWSNVIAADFTGDNRTDVAGRANNGDWHVLVSTGGGAVDQNWGGTWAPGDTWIHVGAADVDNDGDLDIVGLNDDGDLWVAVNNVSAGSSTFTSTQWGLWNSFIDWVDIQIGDFTGDGRADVAGRAGGTTPFGEWWLAESNGAGFVTSFFGQWTEALGWSEVMSGDFTGDLRLDIVGRIATGDWMLSANNGTTLDPPVPWGNWNPAFAWEDVTVIDINADGLMDIVGRDTTNNEWMVAQNTGGGSFTNVSYGVYTDRDYVDVVFADFDNDGLIDAAARATLAPDDGDWRLFRNLGGAFGDEFYGNWADLGWQDVASGFFID
jgi:hypothetical protein